MPRRAEARHGIPSTAQHTEHAQRTRFSSSSASGCAPARRCTSSTCRAICGEMAAALEASIASCTCEACERDAVQCPSARVAQYEGVDGFGMGGSTRWRTQWGRQEGESSSRSRRKAGIPVKQRPPCKAAQAAAAAHHHVALHAALILDDEDEIEAGQDGGLQVDVLLQMGGDGRRARRECRVAPAIRDQTLQTPSLDTRAFRPCTTQPSKPAAASLPGPT